MNHCVGLHPTENSLRNRESKKAIRNHPLIHETLIISVMNVMVGNQIHASDVDRRIIQSNFLKPYTSNNKFHWKTENPKTCAYRLIKIDKTSENISDESKSHKIYTSMACMYTNAEISRSNCGDSSQLTNYLLNSGETCHMTPEILDIILGLLVETNKYIEVADGSFVTAKQTGEVQIKMRDSNGKPFIATIYNLILEPD